MATDPTVNPASVPSTPPVPAPSPAPSSGATDPSVKALATELAKPALPFDPVNMRKAAVTAKNDSATPPTISIQLSGDTTTTIPDVRYINSYSPVVGDTALIVKQGADIFALGRIMDTPTAPATNGWQTAGGASYRKIIDNGAWKLQFMGSFANSGTTMFTLAAGYAPTVTRTISAGRDGQASGVMIQISTGGVVTVFNGTNTIDPTGSTSPGGTTGAASPGATTDSTAVTINGTSANSSDGTVQTSDPAPTGGSASGSMTTSGASAGTAHTHQLGHRHYYGHTHGVNITDNGHTHTLTTNSHTHTLTTNSHTHAMTLALPTVIYLDGVECFL